MSKNLDIGGGVSFSSYWTAGGKVGAILLPPNEICCPFEFWLTCACWLILPPETPGTGAFDSLLPCKWRIIPIGWSPSNCCSMRISLVGDEAASNWSLDPIVWAPFGQTFLHLMWSHKRAGLPSVLSIQRQLSLFPAPDPLPFNILVFG